MEEAIYNLKNEFANVKTIIDRILETKVSIKKKLAQMKDIHAELINENNSKKIFLICLESFHFQYKVMLVDTSNLHRNFLLFTNRTYCDYYGLYNILEKVFNDYKIDIPTTKVHRAYDNLDQFAEYKLDDIFLVRDNVIELIMCLISKLKENEKEVTKYKSKSQSGIRIMNFINTLEYDNKILKDQIELYVSYCDFFQSTQEKYFSKLLEKFETLQQEIDSEIQFQETPWDNKIIGEDDTIVQVVDDCPVSQWNETGQWGVSIEEVENEDKEWTIANKMKNKKKTKK